MIQFPKPPQGETAHCSDGELAALDRDFLDPAGRMVLRGAAFYLAYPSDLFRAWCCTRARYGIPAYELLKWLEERIAGRKALEICAGMGDLGWRLGIPMSDSYQQVREQSTAEYFKRYNLVPTMPPADVIEEDAENAVRKRKPQVVVASWCTEKWIPSEFAKPGNMFGPREDYILERCEEYILIGNEAVHGQRRLLKLPHETFKFPWLVSRAKDQGGNVIYVWKGGRR